MSAPDIDCPDCFGLGCMACKTHGRDFIEVFGSGDHICGQCGDDGKGDEADLPNCTTCGGTGKKA